MITGIEFEKKFTRGEDVKAKQLNVRKYEVEGEKINLSGCVIDTCNDGSKCWCCTLKMRCNRIKERCDAYCQYGPPVTKLNS